MSGLPRRRITVSRHGTDDLPTGPVEQSRRGIERLGARLDGILRSHQINRHPDAAGTLRDTCVYSITAAEWPAVKAHLTHQLTRPRPSGA